MATLSFTSITRRGGTTATVPPRRRASMNKKYGNSTAAIRRRFFRSDPAFLSPLPRVSVRRCCARLIAEAGRQHRRGSLPHGIGSQWRQRTRLVIDAVRCQSARCRAGGEEETAGGVEPEGAGDRFGGHMPDGGQMPGAVDGEPGGQARGGLHCREGTGRTVEPIARYAAALLVGEVNEIQGRMKAVVARTEAFGWFDPRRRIGG